MDNLINSTKKTRNRHAKAVFAMSRLGTKRNKYKSDKNDLTVLLLGVPEYNII